MTVALNCWVHGWVAVLRLTFAAGGETVTDTVIVAVAVADFVLSDCNVAVTITLASGLGMVVGAV
jgi:hypothetical protein